MGKEKKVRGGYGLCMKSWATPTVDVESQDACSTAEDAGRAGAEAPGRRDAVVLGQREGGRWLADPFVEGLDGAVDEVALVAGDAVGALAVDFDLERLADLERDVRAELERESEAVEAGAEVRRGGRDARGDTHELTPLPLGEDG